MNARHALCAMALILATMPARAADSCIAPEFRQFDFWVGDWQVHRAADNAMAGINHVTSEYGGCVVHEHYVTGRGYSGESLNTYDAARKLWHQTWMDSSGLLLVLEGAFDGKSMLLEGQTRGADGKPVKQRIRWTPQPDGSVRQLWESADASGKWATVFDGIYTKK